MQRCYNIDTQHCANKHLGTYMLHSVFYSTQVAWWKRDKINRQIWALKLEAQCSSRLSEWWDRVCTCVGSSCVQTKSNANGCSNRFFVLFFSSLSCLCIFKDQESKPGLVEPFLTLGYRWNSACARRIWIQLCPLWHIYVFIASVFCCPLLLSTDTNHDVSISQAFDNELRLLGLLDSFSVS